MHSGSGHLRPGHGQLTWKRTRNVEPEASQFSRLLRQSLRTTLVGGQSQCSWLGKRCAHMLARDPVPRAKDLKFEAVPVVKKKAQKQGLNKRQQLLAATESVHPSTQGYTANSKTCASSVKLAPCLYNKPTPFRSSSLSCSTRAGTDQRSPAKIDPSHSVLNLGHLWSCSRCKASYSVRAPAKGRLARKCQGKEAKKERAASAGDDSSTSGFAALFFKDSFKPGHQRAWGQSMLSQ